MLWRFTWFDRVVAIQIGKLENHSYSSSKDLFYAEIEQAEGRGHSKHFKKRIIHTKAQLPSTFFVHRESRYETLKYYKLAFQLPGQESRIYFRQGDIPCLFQSHLHNFTACTELDQVEELIMMSKHSSDPFPRGNHIFQMSKIDDNPPWKNDGPSSGNGGLSAQAFVPYVMPLILGNLGLCPKAKWLYSANEWLYNLNPYELRLMRKPESTWSKWTPSPANRYLP